MKRQKNIFQRAVFILLIMIEAVVMNYITALQMPLGFGWIHVSAATIWTWSHWTPPLSLPPSDSLHLFFLLQDFLAGLHHLLFPFALHHQSITSSTFLKPVSSFFLSRCSSHPVFPFVGSFSPRPRGFYFSLRSPPLHPSIPPSLPSPSDHQQPRQTTDIISVIQGNQSWKKK